MVVLDMSLAVLSVVANLVVITSIRFDFISLRKLLCHDFRYHRSGVGLILIIEMKDHTNYLDDRDHEGHNVQGEGGVVGSEVEPCSGKPLRCKPTQVHPNFYVILLPSCSVGYVPSMFCLSSKLCLRPS